MIPCNGKPRRQAQKLDRLGHNPPRGQALPEEKAERSSNVRTASQSLGRPEGGDALRSRELGPLRSRWDGLKEAMPCAAGSWDRFAVAGTA